MPTKIEWADEVLNCITGCTRVSPGCANCYAIGQSYRCAAMGIDKYDGVTHRIDAKLKKNRTLDWTGKIRLHPEVLDKPRKRKTPTRYFVNSMSDTFHLDVPPEFIDRIFQMILDCHWHEFMILTKRPERLFEYLQSQKTRVELLAQTKNVIIMTTIENQEVAQRRMSSLMWIKSFITGFPIGLSCEPLLGPIDFGSIDHPCDTLRFMNWVIVGGESGRNARPMNPAWVRDIKDQCLSKQVPFFLKQWGAWEPIEGNPGYADDAMTVVDGTGMYRLNGWKKQGRLLDGRTWDELPDLMRDRD